MNSHIDLERIRTIRGSRIWSFHIEAVYSTALPSAVWAEQHTQKVGILWYRVFGMLLLSQLYPRRILLHSPRQGMEFSQLALLGIDTLGLCARRRKYPCGSFHSLAPNSRCLETEPSKETQDWYSGNFYDWYLVSLRTKTDDLNTNRPTRAVMASIIGAYERVKLVNSTDYTWDQSYVYILM